MRLPTQATPLTVDRGSPAGVGTPSAAAIVGAMVCVEAPITEVTNLIAATACGLFVVNRYGEVVALEAPVN